ncbi:DeoR family transcriptional regulator [Vibrio breoganii]
MIPAERQKKILSLISQRELLSISELVEELSVSHMTIRRDIAKLEKQGKVVSVSGGVQRSKLLHGESSHNEKVKQRCFQKSSIGYRASDMIPNDAVVYLDAGTTTLEIARNIAKRGDVTVLTNDFAISDFLIQQGTCNLYHSGGYVDRGNRSCVGLNTASFFDSFNIDIAFVSSSSWNLRGLSTPNEQKVAVKQAIVSASSKSVLVTDSSKYGTVAAFHALNISEFDTVVSDSNLPESTKEDLEAKGIEVVIV